MPLASNVSERRFEVALAGALLRAGCRMERAAHAALDVLRTTLQCDAGLLLVPAATGRPRIFGDAVLVSDLNPHGDRSRFIATEDLAGLGTLTVGIGRLDGRALRGPQERLTGRAASMLAAWAVGMLGGSHTPAERRAFSRPLQQEFERIAELMVSSGRNTSAIVVHVDDLSAVTTRRLVDYFRSNLRAFDLVGALGDGDIAIMFCNATPEESAAIAARLRLLGEEYLVGSAQSVKVAMVHHPGGSPSPASMLTAARAAILAPPMSVSS